MLSLQLTKLLVVFFILLLYASNLIAQSLNVDSALRLIKQNNTDSVNGSIYYELARNYYGSDTKKALIWAQEGTKYFAKTDAHHLMTRCMNLEAVCLLILDKHEESINLHYKILKIREGYKDTLGMAESLLNIGNVYYRGQDKNEAVRFYLQSRKYALKYSNIKLLSGLSNNLGNYYKDKYRESKNSIDKNKAIKYLKEAIYYKEKLKTDRTLEKTYNTLTGVYMQSKDFNSAKTYAIKAEKLALLHKNHESVGSSMSDLIKIAIENNDYELAERKLDQLYTYIANNKAFHILNIYDEEMVVLRNKIRNLRSNIFSQSDSVQESNYKTLLLSRQKVREELNIKYETEKKELENANLALKNAIAKDKINKTRINSIISFLFAFVLLGLFLKIKKKNRALLKSESAIKEQAKLLSTQNELLKQSEAFKAKLFSIISHDLKSPLHSLKLIVQLSADTQLSRQDVAILMDKLKKELDITSNLLDDLLFWAKSQLETDSIHWKAFNLNAIVNKCLHTLSPTITIKQLNILTSIPHHLQIWADDIRCEFIIRNILHNAIKYSECCQNIELGIKDIGESWDFYIKDYGIGISEDHLKKMFVNEYSRESKKGTLNEQGAGIGLLLCHDFIESLGWSISVNSKERIGTTFHIFIKKKKIKYSKPTGKLKLVLPNKRSKTPIHLN